MGKVARPPVAALAHSLLMDTSETKISLKKIWKQKVKKMLEPTFDIFKNLLSGAKFM